MSYIIKKNDPLVNVKLTNSGRRNLAEGTLNFTYFGLGDGEMDYSNDSFPNVNILRPSDNVLGLSLPLTSDGVNVLNPITIVNAIPNEVYTSAIERGFFNYDTTGSTITLDSDLWLVGPLTGTTTATNSAFDLTYNGGIINSSYDTTIKEGDYLFVKFKTSGYTTNYTTTQVPADEITVEPVQYLMYVVKTIEGSSTYDLTGLTSGTTIVVAVDRDLPAFDHNYEFDAFIYPGKDTIKDYYDETSPMAYWQGGLLDFSNNNTQSDLDVPVWNMNIINIEDIIGLDSTVDKSKYDVVSKDYLGTAINFGYYDSSHKIGIIHYTNNTVSNFYGEGFYRSTFKLKVPYIMWHKQQFTSNVADTIGYTFVADTELKFLTETTQAGLGTSKYPYYDLVDQESDKTVVGKVFVDEKVVVIDHPELLSALSYKANRNWTLPKPMLTLTEPGICGNTSTAGILQPGEYLYVTYMFLDDAGITGMHCEDYTTIQNNSTSAKDVLFQFNKKINDPNYTEFSFLKDYEDETGIGYKTNQILMLWQKSTTAIKPDPTNWAYIDVSEFLGTNGCVTGVMNVNGTNFEFHADIVDYDADKLGSHTIIDVNVFDIFELGNTPVGEIIVIYNGTVQTQASDDTLSDGTYYAYPTTYAVGPNNRRVIVFGQGYGTSPDLLQIYYLTGTSITSKTIKQVISVPSLATINSNTNANSIYKSTIAPNRVSLKLDKQPNNSTVWLFYKGMLLNSTTYGVFVTNETIDDRRVELNFTPTQGSEITMFYLDNAGAGQTVSTNVLTKDSISALRVNIDQYMLDNSETDIYNLNNYITIPGISSTDFSFGDEVFFFGNIETDIKATIFKTQLTCNVLPNQYISTDNPTFNSDQDKVAFTQIGIFDTNAVLVAIGKFSEPITRKYNSDMVVIQATIDF
jgi:hypothetical protein